MVQWNKIDPKGTALIGARIRSVLPHSNAALKNGLWEAQNPRGGLKPTVGRWSAQRRTLWEAQNPRGGLKLRQCSLWPHSPWLWEAQNPRGGLKPLKKQGVGLKRGDQAGCRHQHPAMGGAESARRIETSMQCALMAAQSRLWEAQNPRGGLKL